MDRAMSFEGVAVPTAALEAAPLFAALAQSDLVSVASVMRFRSFAAGDVICRQGERGERMFVIVDGLVHLIAALPEAPAVRTRSIFDEGRLVGKLRRGEAFGTGSLLTGGSHSATARAAVSTDCLELGREEFVALLGRFPALYENLTHILTERLAEATSRQARGATRGEAVALIVGSSLAEALPDVLDAAAAASPGPVASLDASESLTAALERIDGLLHGTRTVVVTASLDQDDLPALLREVDRAVAVAATNEEARAAAVLAVEHGVRGQPVEAVLVRDARAEDLPDAGDAVRVLRARSGELDADGVAWIGRHLTRTKLGLALGAGGAKGYAHVGVLHVLQDAGYRIDYVSGSSIGAIVGTWLALGLDAAEIETAMRETFTPEAVAETLKISLSGQASGLDAMLEILREIAGERTFADTEIPLAIMTADLTDKASSPLRTGPLWQALVAATALAGVFPPHELDGHRLVDGLAIDPVPTRAVIEDGADVTVAVNLIPRTELPAWPGQAAPRPKEPRKRGSRMLDTLLEVMDLAQLDTSEQGTALADVGITPRFGPGSWRDFDLADLFLAAGREAAQESLPTLEKLARPQFAPVTR
jgi:NTE family protein